MSLLPAEPGLWFVVILLVSLITWQLVAVVAARIRPSTVARSAASRHGLARPHDAERPGALNRRPCPECGGTGWIELIEEQY